MFKALSNPHRLWILVKIVEGLRIRPSASASDGEVNACQRDMAQNLGLAKSTVSHHFKELRDSGLIDMKREGKRVTFQVRSEGLSMLRDLLKEPEE